MTNLTSKLWITEKFICFDSNKENLVSSILPKIYRCDAFKTKIGTQNISFYDFCKINTFARDVIFREITVKNDDGTNVAFEKLVEALPKVTSLNFKPRNAILNTTSKTIKELLKIPHFSKLKYLYLRNIPETFDLDAFYGYMKKNNFVAFYLEFDDSISNAYQTRLEEIIDEIIATKELDFHAPLIMFDGLEAGKFIKLWCLYIKFVRIEK
uniref:DUF38 domain-containing protein n=1 Tax=Panagrolaimus sp. ES5 TaxID=591445 RepID=A0AC34FDV2_9BILA